MCYQPIFHCLLWALMCAGCVAPEASLPPTTQTPSALPTPSPTRVAPTNWASPPATTTPTLPTQTTWESEAVVPPRTPFPMSAEPLRAALQRLGRPAFLLISGYDQLILTNPSSTQALWLTRDSTLCDPKNTSFQQWGEWSPDGRYLAITCGDPIHFEQPTSMLLDMSAGTFQRLKYCVESWSPDGKRLLVSYSKPTGAADKTIFELGVTTIADEKVTPIISFSDNLNIHTAWSPNSEQIAVVGPTEAGADPKLALFIVNSDGSGTRRLRQLEAVDHFYGANRPLIWSRNGSWLLVSRTRKLSDTYPQEMLKVDAQTGAVETLPSTDYRSQSSIRWSPDGAFFFVPEVPQGATNPLQWSLYRVDGTLVRHISSDARHDIDIAWLPDSRSYILAAVRPEYGLVVIRASIDGAEREIAGYPNAGPGNPALAVSPDGSALAVAAPGDYIHILDIDGNTLAELRGRIGSWRP